MSETLEQQTHEADAAEERERAERQARHGRSAAFLGGAALAGFAVGRLAKAGRAGAQRGEK
jgi:hypothetical protein